MAILELPDLKENVVNMHHLASLAYLVIQEHLVKMVNQEHQGHLVGKDKKGKPLTWKKLKIKLKMASNLFARNYETVVSVAVIVGSVLHIMMGLLSVHHMERYMYVVM